MVKPESQIQIVVRGPSCRVKYIKLLPCRKIKDIKAIIQQAYGMFPQKQRLCMSRKQLQDNEASLKACGIMNGTTLLLFNKWDHHLVHKKKEEQEGKEQGQGQVKEIRVSVGGVGGVGKVEDKKKEEEIGVSGEEVGEKEQKS